MNKTIYMSDENAIFPFFLLYIGFFEGPQHQRLVRGRSPRHRGVHVGRVISSNKGAVMLQLDDKLLGQSEPPLKRGDGIVIDRGVSLLSARAGFYSIRLE